MATESRQESARIEKGGKPDEAKAAHHHAHTREYTYHGKAPETTPRYLSCPSLLSKNQSLPLNAALSSMVSEESETDEAEYTWESTPAAFNREDFTLPDRTSSRRVGLSHVMKQESQDTARALYDIAVRSKQASLSQVKSLASGDIETSARKSYTEQHTDEKHGVIRHCAKIGCDYSGTDLATTLKDHMEKEHPELFDVSLNVPPAVSDPLAEANKVELFSSRKDIKVEASSLEDVQCLSAVTKFCQPATPNDVSRHAILDLAKSASCKESYYIGIGAWVLQRLEDMSASPFIDFTAADLYAAFDGCEDGIRQCTGNTGASKSTYKAAESSQVSVNNRNTKGKYPQKRPCKDGRDQDEDNDPGQPKKAKVQESSELDQGRKLACPYYKNRRTCAKHMSCASKYFQDLARLKEHLYRRHLSPPHLCVRCGLHFTTQVGLHDHLRSEDCKVGPVGFSDGITPDVREQIHSRKKHGRRPSPVDRWFDIYRLIFPGEDVPDDPYNVQATQDQVQSPAGLPSLFIDQGLDFVLRDLVPSIERLQLQLVKVRIKSIFAAAGHQLPNTPQGFLRAGSFSLGDLVEPLAPILETSGSHYSSSEVNSLTSTGPAHNVSPSQMTHLVDAFPLRHVPFSSHPAISPVPQLESSHMQSSTGEDLRRMSSGESFADSAYGSGGVCGNLHCPLCFDFLTGDSVETRCLWDDDTPAANGSVLPTDPSDERDINVDVPVISTAEMDERFGNQFANLENVYGRD